ncbi:MAG TPA: tetratricopeptide repeat protein [Nitrospiria bacterium]|jgi:tetratricopeptide (TPR) repeat protein
MAGSEKSLSPEIIKLTEKMARDPASRLFVPLAEEYMKCGMTDEAFLVLTDGLKNHPNYVGAHVSLAKLLWQVGKKAEAKREFEEVVSANPDNVLAHRYLVQLYREEDQLDQALASCRMILNLNPKDPEMQKVLGELETSVFPAKEEKGESLRMGEVPFGEVDIKKTQESVENGWVEEGDIVGEQEEIVMESSVGITPSESEIQNPSLVTDAKASPEDIPLDIDLSSPEMQQEKPNSSVSFEIDNLKGESPMDFQEKAIPEEASMDSSPGKGFSEKEDSPFNFPGEEGLFSENEGQGNSTTRLPSDASINLDLEEPIPQMDLGDNKIEVSEQQEGGVIEISEDSDVDLKSLESAFTSLTEEDSIKKEKKGFEEVEEPSTVPFIEVPETREYVGPPGEVSEPVVKMEPPMALGPEPEEKVDSLEKDDFDTESLAELYVRQGYYDKGIEIYRKLLLSDPSNQGFRQKLDDAVTLASLLTGKNHREFSSEIPTPDGSLTSTAEPQINYSQKRDLLKPAIREQGQEKSPPLDTKSIKIQRLKEWLSNIRKG